MHPGQVPTNESGTVSLGWHVDEPSAVTALLMLSDTSEYTGGDLEHIVNGEVLQARPKRDELLVYRSHQPHRVTALRSGKRQAIALEFWHVQGPSGMHPTRRASLDHNISSLFPGGSAMVQPAVQRADAYQVFACPL